MRLALWSPLPSSPSGVADYVAETLAELARHVQLRVVVERPGMVAPEVAARVDLITPEVDVDADIDLYQIGNSPSHAYVYRAALKRPGVVVLHEWNLHHLVLLETVERGDAAAYLYEMRRAHGEIGHFAGRQIARALGGDMLPALYPLNERLLDGSLAVVGLTEYARSRAARRLQDRPVLHVPHHLALPFDPLPSREEARRDLGLPENALLVTAPGLATVTKRLHAAVRVVARLRARYPGLHLVVAGGVELGLPIEAWARDAGLGRGLIVTGRLSLEDFVRHLVAADVVLALRFPTYGEISGALVRALGVGRPVLVTAGTPAAEEFPEGIVVPIDPGPGEEPEMEAVLDHLLANPPVREAFGRLAREHVTRHHDLASTVARLVAFLSEVYARKEDLAAVVARRRREEEGLLRYLKDEMTGSLRELGLDGVALGIEPLLAELVERPR